MFTTLERHFLVGPDFVTIVDCGLWSYGINNMVGNFDGKDARRRGGGGMHRGKTGRRRMQIVTLVDEGEIKKWTTIKYGEEVQLRMHSSNEGMQWGIGDIVKNNATNAFAKGGVTATMRRRSNEGIPPRDWTLRRLRSVCRRRSVRRNCRRCRHCRRGSRNRPPRGSGHAAPRRR